MGFVNNHYELIILLLISMIIGFLAQKILNIDVGGIFISTILGFVGGSVGVWVAQKINLPEFLTIQIGKATISLVWSIIGTTIVVAILGMIRRIIK